MSKSKFTYKLLNKSTGETTEPKTLVDISNIWGLSTTYLCQRLNQYKRDEYEDQLYKVERIQIDRYYE